jgi:hypothetical protein
MFQNSTEGKPRGTILVLESMHSEIAIKFSLPTAEAQKIFDQLACPDCENRSLLILASGETADGGPLPRADGGLFGGHGFLLLLIGAVGLRLFLRGLLLIRFRGFVAHNYDFCSAS